MNMFYPINHYERGNDFSLLEDFDNSVEKQAHNASCNSSNVRFKDSQDINMKYSMYSNTRSKHLPKASPKSARLQKHVNSVGYEDLTEVTLTDAITEPSDSSKSHYPTKNIFKNLDFCSKTSFLNNKKIMLLAPDESYHNAKKFNHQIYQINYSYINEQNCDSIRLPLLQINDSDFQKEHLFQSIIRKHYLNNNQNELEFLFSLENLKDKNNHFIANCVENRNKQNYKTNKKDLVNVNIDNNSESNILNQPDIKIVEFENKVKYNGINSPLDKSSILINKSIDPDVVLHNGYIITTDSITSQKDMDIISNETNNFSNIKRNKEAIKSDKNNKESSSVAESQNIFQEFKEKISYGIEIDGFNMEEKSNERVSINYEYPSIQDIPILAPDILGKINIRNNEKVKHFLGVKSIDENGWNEMVSINLDNANAKSCSVNEIVFVDSEEINIDKDNYTFKILGTDKNQKNLNQTIQSMNEKISEMEKISLLLDKGFSNSKKVYLNTDKTNVKLNDKQEKMNDKFEKSLNLIMDSKEKDSSKVDNSLLYELSEYSSANELLDISESLTTNSNQLVESFSDNAFNEGINESKVKTVKSINSQILKPFVKINKSKFHKSDKNNYLQRKTNGKYFAMEMLNQLGLPHTKSFDIPVTIVTNPSPNEMMLSEMKRNERLNPLNSMSNFKFISSLQPSKKKIHKPFQESVRLQRPEITRRQNLNKPFTYTESLLALNPKKRNHKHHKPIANNVKLFQPFTEISISQDTNINSVSSDWSIPQKVHEILYNKSQNNSEYNVDDVSQIVSIQSTSFIDWDQVSEMLKSLSVN